jgi:hypothetical protein
MSEGGFFKRLQPADDLVSSMLKAGKKSFKIDVGLTFTKWPTDGILFGTHLNKPFWILYHER